MRKCHYVYDKQAGKVLIPQCWPMIHSNDMNNCTCRHFPEAPKQFERREFNEKLQEQRLYIEELEKENARLIRILKRVNGFK